MSKHLRKPSRFCVTRSRSACLRSLGIGGPPFVRTVPPGGGSFVISDEGGGSGALDAVPLDAGALDAVPLDAASAVPVPFETEAVAPGGDSGAGDPAVQPASAAQSPTMPGR